MQRSPRETVTDTSKDTGILHQGDHVLHHIPNSRLGCLHAFAGSGRNTLLPPVTSQLTQILPSRGEPAYFFRLQTSLDIKLQPRRQHLTVINA